MRALSEIDEKTERKTAKQERTKISNFKLMTCGIYIERLNNARS